MFWFLVTDKKKLPVFQGLQSILPKPPGLSPKPSLNKTSPKVKYYLHEYIYYSKRECFLIKTDILNSFLIQNTLFV